MDLLQLLQEMPECSVRQDYLFITEQVSIPFTILKGKSVQPVLTISAAVHGCEYVGVKTTLELAKDWQFRQSGTVILLHVVNTTGFWQRITTLVPEDRINLNRIFQDKEDLNSLSYQIKDVIQRDIFPVTDYLVDLHGGNAEELLTPHGYYSVKAESGQEESFNMLLASQTPLIYASTNKGGLYQSAAIDYGIPSILLEQGDNGTCLPTDVATMKAAVLRIADYIFEGILPDNATPPIVFKEASYLESPCQGCWSCFVLPNDSVEEGQILGVIHDIFGQEIAEIKSPTQGVVLYQKATLVTHENELLVAIASNPVTETDSLTLLKMS